MHGFEDLDTGQEHIALTRGIDVPEDGPGAPIEDPVLGRVHSECLTGDVFHSLRCDCGAQLEKAMQILATKEHGVLVYLRQEGRGIGLEKKLAAYRLQDQGMDTVEANQALGLAAPVKKLLQQEP